MLFADRDAHADRGVYLPPVEVERLPHHPHDAFRDLHRMLWLDVLAEQHELVAAEPAERVGRSQRRRDAPGHFSQQGVTGFVSERVVGRLELVEVEVHHGEGIAAVVGEGVLHPVEQQNTVDRAGEGVVSRAVRQRVLRRLTGAYRHREPGDHRRAHRERGPEEHESRGGCLRLGQDRDGRHRYERRAEQREASWVQPVARGAGGGQLGTVVKERSRGEHEVCHRVQPVEARNVERRNQRQVRVQHVERERPDERAEQQERGGSALAG